jgi:glycine cleavage system aminomethyltransferase T
MASQTEKNVPSAPPIHDRDAPYSGASSPSLEKDVAIGLVGEHAQEIDPEVEARVLKKIDWFLMPAMIVGTSTSSTPSHQHQPFNIKSV